MKCNQSRLEFELVSPCPFPTTITITARVPPNVSIMRQESPSGVVANVQDCDIVVSDFKPHSRSYIYFLIPLGKVLTPLSAIAVG